MKIIKHIVQNEGLSTKRVYPYISDVLFQLNAYYFANYSIILEELITDSTLATCSPEVRNTNPYYQIVFPYDTVLADTIEVTTFKGYRYPKSVRIQGTQNFVDYFDIVQNSPALCTVPDSYNQCNWVENVSVSILKNRYRGFKIYMNGADSIGTTQLCIGHFEVLGSLIHKCSSKREIKCILFVYIFVFLINKS